MFPRLPSSRPRRAWTPPRLSLHRTFVVLGADCASMAPVQSDASTALSAAGNMSIGIATSVQLLLFAVAGSRDIETRTSIPPKSIAAQKIVAMSVQRTALGTAHCELTAIQGCSYITQPSGQALTRPYAHCGHSVSMTGGFCSLNAMNGMINPLMATRLVEVFAGDSVVDLGAGQGQYSILADVVRPQGGSQWYSVDSTENIHALTEGSVHFADLTAPADIQGIVPADWVLCIEAAEHVPRSAQASLIANIHFLNRKGVVLSWVLPNQPGSHHVNGRTNDYVEQLFSLLGYTRDRERESYLRDAIAVTMDRPALEASHSGKTPPFAFWGIHNTIALQSEVAKVKKNIPRHKTRLVTLSPTPWLYDSLMVFRRRQLVQPTPRPALNRVHLQKVLEVEQIRLEEQAARVSGLRDRLVGSPGSIGRHAPEEVPAITKHVRQAAARVAIPQTRGVD